MQTPPTNTNPLDATTNLGSFGTAEFITASGAASLPTGQQSQIPKTISPRTIPEEADEIRSARDEGSTFVQGAERYRTLGELGRGGWGYVLKARDEQLERPVAVKQISGTLSNREAIHQRFLHEAKITGQLQHPGIVPVHELGVASDGNPFYVMKLLEGITFKQSIAEVHDAGKSLPAGYSIELLDRFLDVCNAVAFAHQRRVIHRDLKPANIMIGKFGETVVVDWGLAKQIDNECVERTSPLDCTLPVGIQPAAGSPPKLGNDDQTLQPGDSSSVIPSRRPKSSKVGDTDSHTRQGSILGTPAYMSPEQSRGEVDALTPATDIYALGVTLYEVLTGENPFRAGDVETTLSRVQAGEYRPPRSVKSGVPKALAAICETAMAHQPEDRYASAELIVQDIQRFLANEPVSVYREPLWIKMGRWCRRKPALSAGIFGAVGVLTASSLVFSAIIHRAHQSEQQARLAAEAAQQQALSRLADSRQAGDAWLVDLSGALQYYPGLHGMRQQLLKQAVAHYEKLARCLSEDQVSGIESQLEQAKCHVRLGDLYRLLEDSKSAEQHYQTSNSLLTRDEQEARRPLATHEEHHRRTEAINARIGLALLLNSLTADSEIASQLREDAQWLRTQLGPAQISVEPTDQLKYANTFARLQLAIARSVQAENPILLKPLQEAETWAEFLVEERAEPRDHQLLQTIRDEYAAASEREGQLTEVCRIWKSELARLDSLINAADDRPDLLQSRAFAAMNYASVLARLGLQADSSLHYQAASEDLERAWLLSDADAYYQRNTAITKANLGMLALEQGTSHQIAEEHLVTAIQHLRQATANDGPVTDDLLRLAECYESLGQIYVRQGDSDALKMFDRAVQCYEVLADYGALAWKSSAKRARMLTKRTDALLLANMSNEASDDLERAEQLLVVAKSADQLTLVERAWIDRLEAQRIATEIRVREHKGDHESADSSRKKLRSELTHLANEELAHADTTQVPQASLMLVDHLLESEDIDGDQLELAAAYIEKVLHSRPRLLKNFDWLQRRALVHWLKGDLLAAREALIEAEELRPSDAILTLLRAALSARTGSADNDEISHKITELREALPGDHRIQIWSQKLSSDPE